MPDSFSDSPEYRKAIITFRLTDTQAERLDHLARARGMGRGGYIRAALDAFSGGRLRDPSQWPKPLGRARRKPSKRARADIRATAGS